MPVIIDGWTLRYSSQSVGLDIYERRVGRAYLPALTQFTVVRHDQIPAGIEWGGGLATWIDRHGVIGQRADALGRWTVPTTRDDGRAGVVLLPTEIALWIAKRNAMPAMLIDGSYVRLESLEETAAPAQTRYDHAPEIATARERVRERMGRTQTVTAAP